VAIEESLLDSFFIFVNLFFFDLIKHHDLTSAVNDVRTKFWTGLFNSVTFWTPLTFVTYAVIPMDGRVIFVTSFLVFWQAYVSYLANNKLADPGKIGLNAIKMADEI